MERECCPRCFSRLSLPRPAFHQGHRSPKAAARGFLEAAVLGSVVLWSAASSQQAVGQSLAMSIWRELWAKASLARALGWADLKANTGALFTRIQASPGVTKPRVNSFPSSPWLSFPQITSLPQGSWCELFLCSGVLPWAPRRALTKLCLQ